jgi:hypothetical protein
MLNIHDKLDEWPYVITSIDILSFGVILTLFMASASPAVSFSLTPAPVQHHHLIERQHTIVGQHFVSGTQSLKCVGMLKGSTPIPLPCTDKHTAELSCNLRGANCRLWGMRAMYVVAAAFYVLPIASSGVQIAGCWNMYCGCG